MRVIPGMTVICPCDDAQARAAVRAAYEHDGPVYLRFSRAASPAVYEGEAPFEIGKGVMLREGTDVALLANGLLVYEALQAAETLAEEGISARVIDLATIKPLDEEIVLQAAKECRAIVTCEEHSIIGGLGEAVAALLCEKGAAVPMARVGVRDVFGTSGTAKELMKAYGLTSEQIVQSTKTLFASI